MMSVLWFAVGVPLAIETLSALLSFRDLVRKPGLRAAALERLIMPTLFVGIGLWLATPAHWAALGNAALAVLSWQVLAWTIADRTIGKSTFAAESIDTDDEI